MTRIVSFYSAVQELADLQAMTKGVQTEIARRAVGRRIVRKAKGLPKISAAATWLNSLE